MADIIVKIAINPSGTGEIGSIATNYSELLNNISIKADNSGVFDVLTKDNFSGTEMLAFNKGVLSFNKAGFLSNRQDGDAGKLQSSKQPRQYIWGRTDDNGYALDKEGNIIELVLTLESTSSDVNFDSIVIVGDSVSKQFPIEAYLDDSTEAIYSDDAKWAIKFNNNATTHTIRIVRWNRPNYNAVLSAVRVMYKYINIGDKALQSVNSLSETSSDISTINYGTLANSGSIDILDSNGEIEDLIRDEILPNSDVELEVQYNGKTIQHHITNDTNYESDTKNFNLSLTNRIKDLDILTYKGFVYPNQSQYLYYILFDVMKSLSGGALTEDDFVKMTSNKCVANTDTVLDVEVEDELFIYEYLKKIVVDYPFIEGGKTYREVIDEICTIAQLRMFVNENNEYEFVSARPLLLSTDKPCLLEPKIMKEEPITDIVVKNKFKAVDISEFNVIDETDYDTVVYPASVTLNSVSDSSMTKQTKNNQAIVQRSQFISSATFYYEIVSYITSDYYYYTGNITIPKKSSDNLSQITSVNDSLLRTNNFAYRVTYSKYKGTVSADSVWDRGDNKVSVSNISYGSESFDSQTSQDGVIEDISEFPYTLPDGTVSTPTTSTKPNSPSIQFTSDDDNYYVTYNICVRKKLTKLGGYGRWTSASTSSVNIPMSGEFENYYPMSLEFSVYGNKRTISFEQVSASSPNIESEKYKASIKSNKLLSSKTRFYKSPNIQKISETIKRNIIADYNNGVQSKSISAVCYNMYDADGSILIDKNNGDIIKPLDVIFTQGDNYPDGSQKYWRVFSREFIYDGEPYLKLITEEIKNIRGGGSGGLFTKSGIIIKSWADMIKDGDITVENNTVKSATDEFRSAKGILKIGSGIEVIDLVAFVPYLDRYNNSYLDEIVVPRTVKSISSDAEYTGRFNNLSKITFEENSELEIIGDLGGSFDSITIPENVKTIGRISVIHKEINYNAVLCDDCDGYVLSVGKYTPCIFNVGPKVQRIPSEIVYNKDVHSTADDYLNIVEVNFDKNSVCESIGRRAFAVLPYFRKVNIPSSMKIIEPYAFNGSGFGDFDAFFEKQTGWFVADTPDATSGTDIDVSDSKKAGYLLAYTHSGKYFINKT